MDEYSLALTTDNIQLFKSVYKPNVNPNGIDMIRAIHYNCSLPIFEHILYAGYNPITRKSTGISTLCLDIAIRQQCNSDIIRFIADNVHYSY